MEERRRQTVKLTFMMLLTLAFFVAEITGGYITNSLALVGDSYHMISDVLSLFIGLSCLVISTRSSKYNTFGWARAEILGALVNSVFLAALCFTILLEAVERLAQPQRVKEPVVLLVIGVLGLLVNLLGLLLFCNETHTHSHSHLAPISRSSVCEDGEDYCYDMLEKKNNVDKPEDLSMPHKKSGNIDSEGDTDNNGHSKNAQDIKPVNIIIPSTTHKRKKEPVSGSQMNIRGVFLHMMGDALGSLVVIVSALVAMFCKGSWVKWVDPVLSMIMVAIILSTTYPLFKQSSLILMQHVPEHIRVAELSRRMLSEIEGILGIHELHIWQLVGRKNIASMHVKCRNAQEYEILSVKIKEFLHNEGIHSTTIQPEFVQSHGNKQLEQCTMHCVPASWCQKHWCCSDQQSLNT